MNNTNNKHLLLQQLTTSIEDDVITTLSVKLNLKKRDLWDLYVTKDVLVQQREEEEEQEEELNVVVKKSKANYPKRLPRLPIPHAMIFRAMYTVKQQTLTIIYNGKDNWYAIYPSLEQRFSNQIEVLHHWKEMTCKSLVYWGEFKPYDRIADTSIKSMKNAEQWNTFMENSAIPKDVYCDVDFQF